MKRNVESRFVVGGVALRLLVLPFWSRSCLVAGMVALLAICGIAGAPPVVAMSDDEELAELTERLKQEPNRVDLLKKRAILLLAESKPADALTDLDRLRKLVPDDQDIHLQRALTLSTLRRDNEAEVELTSFLRLAEGQGRARALAERGHVRARTKRSELAIADFTDALAFRPALDVYLQRGKLHEAAGQLGAAATGYQDGIKRIGRSYPLISALIKVQVQQGQYQAALALIDSEAARTPVKTRWHLRRAEVLAAMGQSSEAELNDALDAADDALEKRPTAINLAARARALLGLGRLEEAREDLQICLQINPRYPECRELLKGL